jgi:hypothetical protein
MLQDLCRCTCHTRDWVSYILCRIRSYKICFPSKAYTKITIDRLVTLIWRFRFSGELASWTVQKLLFFLLVFFDRTASRSSQLADSRVHCSGRASRPVVQRSTDRREPPVLGNAEYSAFVATSWRPRSYRAHIFFFMQFFSCFVRHIYITGTEYRFGLRVTSGFPGATDAKQIE